MTKVIVDPIFDENTGIAQTPIGSYVVGKAGLLGKDGKFYGANNTYGVIGFTGGFINLNLATEQEGINNLNDHYYTSANSCFKESVPPAATEVIDATISN